MNIWVEWENKSSLVQLGLPTCALMLSYLALLIMLHSSRLNIDITQSALLRLWVLLLAFDPLCYTFRTQPLQVTKLRTTLLIFLYVVIFYFIAGCSVGVGFETGMWMDCYTLVTASVSDNKALAHRVGIDL
jgi:predicted transporter